MRLQAFAGGNGDVGRTLQRRHRVHVFRRHRFLQEERIERLEHLDDTACRSDVPLPVRFHADVERRTAFADAANHFPDLVQNRRRKLAVGAGIRTKGIVLARRRALLDQFLRALPVRFGRARDLAPAITGVYAQPVVDLAAQQLVDRYIQFLAEDVPQRDVDRAYPRE